MNFQVPIPYAVLFQAKIGGAVAPYHEGKAAGLGGRSRVVTGKNLELDH